VLKFYETMYGNYTSRFTKEQIRLFGEESLQSVRAMHLWNDWNLQVETMLKTSNNGIEFLMMRSEDLISSETRLEAIHALADFVGSPLSERELCCKAHQGTKDFGKSVFHQKGYNDYAHEPPPPQQGYTHPRRRLIGALGTSSVNTTEKNAGGVHQRYGKWQKLLADRPEVSAFLHQEGKEPLRVFGYEPATIFSYYTPPNTKTALDVTEQPFVCMKEVACG
jgi:hypothetical protein